MTPTPIDEEQAFLFLWENLATKWETQQRLDPREIAQLINNGSNLVKHLVQLRTEHRALTAELELFRQGQSWLATQK